MKKFALIQRAPFYSPLPIEGQNGIPTIGGYPVLDVRRYGAHAAAGFDDKTAIQYAIDTAEAMGGGLILLQPYHEIASGLEIANHGVRLVYTGGAARDLSVEAGGRLIYTGGAGYGVKFNGGSGGIRGVGLEGVRLENQGSGDVGLHIFNVSNSQFDRVHMREWADDNILLECDTNSSTIYNSFRGVSGFTADASAIGLRMVEGAAKAVNNNSFIDAHFGNNLVGIQQDSEAHDNSFIVLELGSCVTGAKIRGRTTLICANIEGCTTGLDLVTGSAYGIFGSIHFSSNTTDVSNPDGRPLAAFMQSGGSGNSWGFNPTNTGLGFRGRVPPSTGGFNFSTTDGSPKIQRADVDHIEFLSGKVRHIVAAQFDGNIGFYTTTPVAKPTGVAVTAAGIHAALVTLGLIAA